MQENARQSPVSKSHTHTDCISQLDSNIVNKILKTYRGKKVEFCVIYYILLPCSSALGSMLKEAFWLGLGDKLSFSGLSNPEYAETERQKNMKKKHKTRKTNEKYRRKTLNYL